MNVYKPLLMLGVATLVVNAASSAERKVVMPAISPRSHAGQAYVALGLISSLTNSPITRNAKRQEVRIERGGREVRLRVGSQTAIVNGQKVRLAVAPYVLEGNLMVPVRLVAEALDVSVQYEERTASILVKPASDATAWSVPLETRRTGIVIHSPDPGAVSIKQVRVHGQANTPDSKLVVQLQTEDGRVLQESVVPHTGGVFREFITFFLRANSNGGAQQVRVVAFSPDPKNGSPRYRVSVPVTLHLADTSQPTPQR